MKAWVIEGVCLLANWGLILSTFDATVEYSRLFIIILGETFAWS
jgi:hypothetical protein